MKKIAIAAAALVAASTGLVAALQDKPKVGYTDTPMLPDGKWRVHDGTRPQPRIVTPGDQPGAPPSDAIVLFDGKTLDKWKVGKDQAPGWKVENGYMEVPPKGTPNGGEITSRDEFGDIQLHVEWCTPNPPKGKDQGRGNSGLFLMGRYEVQVLDCFENQTYPDGQAGALYGQCPPLVNASRKPGEWQVYDIVWIAPRFKEGKLESPATLTVFHNGVLLHNKKELIGTTNHKTVGTYKEHGLTGPIKIQDHGDPVRFRNIWVRPLKGYDEP